MVMLGHSKDLKKQCWRDFTEMSLQDYADNFLKGRKSLERRIVSIDREVKRVIAVRPPDIFGLRLFQKKYIRDKKPFQVYRSHKYYLAIDLGAPLQGCALHIVGTLNNPRRIEYIGALELSTGTKMALSVSRLPAFLKEIGVDSEELRKKLGAESQGKRKAA